MKTRILSALFILGVSSLTLFAGSKTEKFKVAGNCGMCEARIEKAANSVDGVSEADWNKETKLLEVTFDADQTDVLAIHKAVAEAGHDTEKSSAEEEVYNELPGCCKYERISGKKSSEC